MEKNLFGLNTVESSDILPHFSINNYCIIIIWYKNTFLYIVLYNKFNIVSG